VLIVAPKYRRKAELLLKGAKVEASWGEAPSADAVIARDQERLLADPVWTEEVTEAEATMAKRLTDLYDAGQIAAAYLRLFNARQSAPEELSPAGDTAPPRPKSDFGASTWFSVAGGRKAGAEPRRLLPMLCKLGNITKDDIGAIRVQEDESFVEILSSSVSSFMASLGPAMAVDGGARVRRLDTTPDLTRAPRPAFVPRPAPQTPRAEPRPEPRPDPAKAPVPDRPAPVAEATPAPVSRPAPPKVAPDRARNPSVRIEPPGTAADKPRKPRHKASGRKPAPAAGGTPVGKPSSKKNRARALAAKLAGEGKGGEAPPRRGKRKPPR
jgi:ATP-dependent RNA helicase DeaD